ncbi:MAG: hypothetical protein IKN17_03980 [Ruminococcus sp.]|nr:hypothetical protein [Ruminococcus sp.]
MLKGLISAEDCAACRLCCIFDGCDVAGTPVITPETKEKIISLLPEQRFIELGGALRLCMKPLPGGEAQCPLLDPERGCIMGGEKPFECALWPVTVMRRDESLVLTLSPDCPVANSRPPELIRRICAGIAEEVFKEAERCPALIRPCKDGAVICAEQGKE